MVKLVSLIVTYNRFEKLKFAINQWMMTDVYKIVVVNNHSTDKTEEYLRVLLQNDTRLKVLNLSSNTGGAGGFYTGLKFIGNVIKDYDWVVLQDDDAYPDPASINYFLYKKDLTTADAYMSAVFYPSGRISDMNVPGFFPFKDFKQAVKTFLRGSKGFHIEEKCFGAKEEINVDFASFVGLFLCKELIKKVGLPRKEFFIYGDDLEYTIRITKNNFKIKFDPRLIFFHDCETLDPMGKKIYKPLWKAYFTYRNGLVIYRSLSGRLFPLVFVSKFLIWFFNGLFYENKKSYYRLLFRAIRDGLRENFSLNEEILKNFDAS